MLSSDSPQFLVSMAVKKRRTLKQGDVKNNFCNRDLPPEEVPIAKPPLGNPSAAKNESWLLKKTLYGLQRSPKHWHNKIDGVI